MLSILMFLNTDHLCENHYMMEGKIRAGTSRLIQDDASWSHVLKIDYLPLLFHAVHGHLNQAACS